VLRERATLRPPADRRTLPVMWCACCGWRIYGEDIVLDHGVVPYHPACRAIRGELIVEREDDD
jgi:hypothetical protein